MLRSVADTHAVIWYIFADSRLSVTKNFLIVQAPGFIPSQTQDGEIKNVYPRNLPPEFIRGVNASI
ncbi:hypothetical protein Osc7112_5858 [Oscillatoria nigro-viridis PCC 7112]|uniref:Uncharacterized protein n=1 Tax=Phormidium nigroviride PCC 7112 TaxID=179408 RepID=K9VS95_9CYAN|nr:hypothetical protein Osc7112_5858 [Oscillatoria nigro-viridis PCC 7112]